MTESSRKSFNFKAVKRDLVLLLINFMDENAYLHMYVVSKRHNITLSEFLNSGKFSQGKDRQKLITSQVPGSEKSASNFVFNIKFVLKSRRYIYILLCIFLIFCSLSENGFVQSSSLAKLQKRFSNESRNNLTFIEHFRTLPMSAAQSICSFKHGDMLISSFSDCE